MDLGRSRGGRQAHALCPGFLRRRGRWELEQPQAPPSITYAPQSTRDEREGEQKTASPSPSVPTATTLPSIPQLPRPRSQLEHFIYARSEQAYAVQKYSNDALGISCFQYFRE